ncbi:MAG: ATP-binding protein [Acutalibacter sp.]|nr:ATP-binding protein [Acutalibacter sp.]
MCQFTTKADESHPHGLGIESIRTTAEKYGGTLENRFQNGKFYSTVFLNLKV